MGRVRAEEGDLSPGLRSQSRPHISKGRDRTLRPGPDPTRSLCVFDSLGFLSP